MKDFDELVSKVKAGSSKARVALAGAADAHALEAVLKARDEGLIEPVLVDHADYIRKAAGGLDLSGANIADCHRDVNPAQRAVELINAGEADFLMKGRLETRELLKPVVDKANGLYTGRLMTLLTMNRLPGYHKLLMITDAGMVICPDLEQKRRIIQNAAEVFHRLGNDDPKVAVLCGIEKLNPKMQETVDAKALAEMCALGELAGCTVVGPISYDVAMSASIAKIKGYECEFCGDFDMLAVPSLAAGNILNKCMTVSCGAEMAGLVVGARVPVVLSSRGSSAEEKYYSIALAAYVSRA